MRCHVTTLLNNHSHVTRSFGSKQSHRSLSRFKFQLREMGGIGYRLCASWGAAALANYPDHQCTESALFSFPFFSPAVGKHAQPMRGTAFFPRLHYAILTVHQKTPSNCTIWRRRHLKHDEHGAHSSGASEAFFSKCFLFLMFWVAAVHLCSSE